MLVENILVRPLGNGQVSLSWTSASDEVWSWIFLNGKLVCGPYMAETKNRSVTIPVSTSGTFIAEVHDFEDETVPTAITETPLVKPQIAWNAVENAAAYRVYHTIFDNGQLAVASQTAPGYAVAHEATATTMIAQVPPMGMDRMEIDCPQTLEGRNGRWHSFRVESVDQFGNESENEVATYFAADLPPVPNLEIARDTETGRLSFRIRLGV